MFRTALRSLKHQPIHRLISPHPRPHPTASRPFFKSPSNLPMAPKGKRQRSSEGLTPAAVAQGGIASDLVAFCNFAWTPYHAVEEASRRLLNAGGNKNLGYD